LRRKIIANSLRNMGLTPEQVSDWLKIAGVDGQRRAESLSLADFARLEAAFAKWRQTPGDLRRRTGDKLRGICATGQAAASCGRFARRDKRRQKSA
jgi:hypothetical protein